MVCAMVRVSCVSCRRCRGRGHAVGAEGKLVRGPLWRRFHGGLRVDVAPAHHPLPLPDLARPLLPPLLCHAAREHRTPPGAASLIAQLQFVSTHACVPCVWCVCVSRVVCRVCMRQVELPAKAFAEIESELLPRVATLVKCYHLLHWTTLQYCPTFEKYAHPPPHTHTHTRIRLHARLTFYFRV
jgi:hypothetical protein